ncbi:bile acid:sodium symporter [Nibricoccus aquaticus]|uniref:Bile acid:sodium symporter n=1 Tax=Nibricoccus aquaticus TaxID=2576891 RepID=A0A290QCN9_9BACT|nr:bile acid:sodium symporter family protein [Nibricoccus aquaticus]ATC64970.1 bile acid:sodium symporter [Nibricoccus aquaticus]
MKFKFDWFLWGMVVAVALAWLIPGPGAHGGWLHPELLNKAGVAVIFFLSGVSLSFAAMKAGALRWPVHVVVQTTTFLIFPLVGVALLWLTDRWISPELNVGFFFLCALPSTVSSSVAMTAAARGNVPVAVFNATLSSLIGVIVTPLWISWRLHTEGGGVDLGKVILDLMLWLVLPLVLGQLARPWLAEWAKRNKKFIHVVDRGTILLIIYTSFCDSIARGVWSGQGLSVVAIAVVGSLILFFVVLWIVEAIAKMAGFNVEDRIATVFCGSKKTIASGVPMAQLIFAADPRLGVILLPLMIYHPLQLVICGVLAGRWAKRPGV